MRNPCRFSLSLPFALALAALPGLPLTSPAQQPAASQPVPQTKTGAREVVLPVTVRDKKGALAAGLDKSGFTLTEDGRPQTIRGFTRESAVPLRLGLLVDTGRGMTGAMEAERKAAGSFVDRMLPAEAKEGAAADQAFLIHFDHMVELLRDFTSSREKLHHELEDMGPSHGSRDDRQGPETADDERGSRGQGRGSRGGTQLYDAIFLASDELMKASGGRNVLVVFSDGVDRGSKETLNEAVDAAEHSGVEVYTIYLKSEQERPEGGYPGMG
ncbi:MAG: VWA domain-containing protein, partial [Terracidiphilus sp.]